MLGAPAASCAHRVVKNAHEYSQRGRHYSPASPRNGLRLIAYSPRRSGFLASVACRIIFRKLDAGVEASGPHVFAVRFSAVRYRHLGVHRIPPRVRDDREPPLRGDEMALFMEVIWVKTETDYFFLWDSTAPTTPNLARRARVFVTLSARSQTWSGAADVCFGCA